MINFFNTIWQIIWPISPIEALLTVFALFAWSRIWLKFRAKLANQKELAFWSLVWFLTIIIVFLPGKTSALAKVLGMGRGFDAMVFIAIVALFYSIYRLYIKANEIEQEITQIVRQNALHLGIKKRKDTRYKIQKSASRTE